MLDRGFLRELIGRRYSGAWKNEAITRVARYISSKLENCEHVTVVA